MNRRRRPVREIAFSFDSFLDVVANVVGIILRLILVAWVGARTYKGPPLPPPPAPAVVQDADLALPDPHDPLEAELEQERRDMAAAQALLLEQLGAQDQARDQKTRTAAELAAIEARRRDLEARRISLQRKASDHGATAKSASLTLEEVRNRLRQVSEEMGAMKQAPSLRHDLRYRAPVSQVLQTEELFFECHNGRVTVIDVGGLLAQVNRVRDEKAKLLRSQWEASDVTEAAGAFRMRYTLEREQGVLESGGVGPPPEAGFRYDVSWRLEPVDPDRGEAEGAALAPGSAFRRVVDSLDPKQTAVTFWVYSDSFSLYRRLRDYLYEHDVVVAGRPLVEGMPISAGRRGTASRGQ